MMDGIINIYKERGYTSFDAVARLRGISGQRKIGHTGTLDPDAEGVLPICLGTATKVCDILTDRSKAYEAVMLLGVATDSEDFVGNICSTAEEQALDALADEQITQAIESFNGTYMQTPPMFSAIRVGGERLYDMARAGINIEREKREVCIDKIERISDVYRGRLSELLPDDFLTAKYGHPAGASEEGHWQHQNKTIYDGTDIKVIRVAFRVECSKGTYIRSLCRDIGEKLGVGGIMEQLLRIRVGEFGIEDAITLYEAETMMKAGRLEAQLHSPDSCFMMYPRLDSKKKYDDILYNGNVMYFRHFSQYITEPPSPVRVYTSKGEFMALYEYNREKNRYKPLKMFRSED